MDDSGTTGSIPTDNIGVPAEAGSSELLYRDHEVGSDQHDDRHDDRHDDHQDWCWTQFLSFQT